MHRIVATAAIVLGVVLVSGCSPADTLINRLPEKHDQPCVSNVVKASPAPPDTNVQQAETVAMPEVEFWSLIAELNGSNAPAGYTALSAKLAQRPLTELIAFEARMTISLYTLDDECRSAWYSKNDPTGLTFVADDDFLYARADTVSAGRAVWDDAVQNDTLPWGDNGETTGSGESLLYVAMDAAKLQGTTDDEWFARVRKTFELSYETGSNPAGWLPHSG